MPYNPHEEYHGDKFLYDAISGAGHDLGQAASKAIQDYEKNKQEREVADWSMEHLARTPDSTGKPIVSIEDLNEYHNANSNKKATIFRSVVTTGAMEAHRQLQNIEAQKAADDHALALAHAAYYSAAAGKPGDAEAHQAIEDEYRNRTLQQQWDIANLKNNGGEDNKPVITDPLKINDKEIPGIGVNRKTGVYVYFGESGMERDPKTGALGVRDTHHNFKPLTAQQLTALIADPNNPLQQKAAPPSPRSWKQILFDGGSQNGAAQPQSKADHDALPSGATYTAPDGSIRTKR